MLLAIGCYTVRSPEVAGGAGEGIRIVDLDGQTGALSDVATFAAGIRNPSYLATSRDGRRLYAAEELSEEEAPELYTYDLDPETGNLELVARTVEPGAYACHAVADPEGRFLFVSNYGSGDLLCYRLSADGLPEAEPQVVRSAPVVGSEGSRLHCSLVLPGATELIVCDAGRDVIASFTIDAAGLSPVPIRSFSTPEGSFPRHIALAPSGRAVLLATEYSSQLQILGVGTEGLTPGTSLPAVPAEWSGKTSGAAVRVHPNGRFAYMSNRGHDSIFGAATDEAALTLTPIGNWSTEGQTPRDFAIDPSGRWLVAANQDSGNLTVFSVDQASGALTYTGQSFATGSPVCVLPIGA
jgi:6-phosphogluconolactonase